MRFIAIPVVVYFLAMAMIFMWQTTAMQTPTVLQTSGTRM
jgi:hypothetical protein